MRFPLRAPAVLAPARPPGNRSVQGRSPSTTPGPAGVPQERGVRGGAHVPSPHRQASRDQGGSRGPATELRMRFAPRLRLPSQTLQSNTVPPSVSLNRDGGRGGPRSSQGGPPAGGSPRPGPGWTPPAAAANLAPTYGAIKRLAAKPVFLLNASTQGPEASQVVNERSRLSKDRNDSVA